MDHHIYKIESNIDKIDEIAGKLDELRCFLNEDKSPDNQLKTTFPIELFGLSDEELKIIGSKSLIDSFLKLDIKKDDFREKLSNVQFIGLDSWNKLLFNFPRQNVTAKGIYSFSRDFLRQFGLEKYLDFCIENDCIDLFKENIDKLFKKISNEDNDKQYRLLQDTDKNWCLRGFTSERYNNYDNNVAIYLSLLALHNYAKVSNVLFRIKNYCISDSSLYLLIEQEVPKFISDVGDIYVGLALTNGEIRNRTFKADIRYRIVNNSNGLSLSAILNESLFSIVHSTGIPKIQENLNNLFRIAEKEEKIFEFISALKATEPLSADAIYFLLMRLVKRINDSNDISRETREKFRQIDIRNILGNTYTLFEVFDKINSIQTDIDEKVYIERIFHMVMKDLIEKRDNQNSQ